MTKSRFINLSVTTLSAVFFLLSLTLTTSAQPLLHTCSQANNGGPFVHIINQNTAETLSSTEITLEGVDVNGCTGMSKDPTTGVCWIVLATPNTAGDDNPGPRILATIDTDTGIATQVGNLGDSFAGLAFDSGGTLYGVTGDGANLPSRIFTINKSTAAPTFFLDLGTDGDSEDGEAIGFNPLDGLMYHVSGNGEINIETIFESVNLASKNIDRITLMGNLSEYDENTALVYQGNNVLLAAQRSENALHSITTNGLVSFIGFMDHRAKGLAFDCGTPGFPSEFTAIPTLSEWGLIITVAALGLISFFALRRRSAAQG